MTTKLKIPKIRFKEFSWDWEEKKLWEVWEIVWWWTPDTFKNEYWGWNIQWFTPTELKSKYVSNSNRTITDLWLKKSSAKILPKNTLLLSSRATIWDISIALNECTTNQWFQSIIVNNKNDFNFFYFLINNNKKELIKKASGSTFLEISKTEILKLKIFSPQLPEQQKIASFLSSVDEKIEKIKEKKKNLEEYKKWVMQKIFSQGVRFKDENWEEFGEWEEKKLGEICDIIVWWTPSTINPLFWNWEINWLSSWELNNWYITETSKKITELWLKKSATKLMPINTVLLAMTWATLWRIWFLKIESSWNQSIAWFIPNLNYNSKFLFYTLENSFNYILSFAAWAAQPWVNKTTIENFTFSFPTLKEQEKIADFLSGIDKKIEKINDELRNYEEFKKGLLQGMFV